jgi:citrate synthase
MSAVQSSEVQSGLEGVVAFATEIAEPDKEGGALRYRGVDIETWSAPFPTSRCGACWWTGASNPACRRRNRTR